jgi:REP element-mobilizing transposase RayT
VKAARCKQGSPAIITEKLAVFWVALKTSKIDTFEWQSRMVGVFRDLLPHWVAEEGRYAVTLRCRGSLPVEILRRLREQHASQTAITPADDRFRVEQRRLFLMLEHYLDQGLGFAPLGDQAIALGLSRWLREYHHEGLRFSEWVVMPNHLHLITWPMHAPDCEHFRKAWIRFKMRSTRLLNVWLAREGAIWQRSWFDRLIRDGTELEKWQRYLEQNPVKAKLCTRPEQWPGGSSYSS